MTLGEIDDALDAWNERLSAAAQNLLDLQSEPVYQQISGAGGAPKTELTGATAARVQTALGAMTNVFQHFGLLNGTIGRARTLRADLPAFFGADQKLQEIADVLRGKSIHLPPVEVAFEQRTLLSGVRNVDRISPDELLEVMTGAFQAAKNAVVAVDRAWRTLGAELGGMSTRIADLRQRAGVLGMSPPVELNQALSLLEKARTGAQSDPLGGVDRLQSAVEPLLARAEQTVVARERLGWEIADGLAAAHRQMDLLADLHRQAVAASADAQLKIANCSGLKAPAADATVSGLREWLERLDKKRAEGDWEPLRVGVRNWNSSAAECVALEREALAANRGPVETRNELRGRLEALKAKARARGVAEGQALAAVAREAESLLYARPTALDLAAAAVESYERCLNGREGTNRR